MSSENNELVEDTIDFRKVVQEIGEERQKIGNYQPSHDDYQVEGNCRRWIGVF